MKNEAEVITRLRAYEPLWDGWYYNEKLFGSGGSGCVLGLSCGEEKSVVKVIYIEDNQLKYNAVKDEIETMVTLRSEYLVECLDYHIEEVFNRKGERIGYDFLIRMNEYEPFSEFLREEDYDPNELCVQLSRDIGEALCVLHSNGILHRDIKPENIFIDSSNGERHFRLGDFGVSKRIGDMSGLTTTGTLNFMAPESFKYYEYSYRSDIYNLGMTLYYILNDLRFPVFSEEESQSDFDYNTDCRLHGEKLPKPMYGSDMLVKVVIKCCEANPKDRYKDISEMLNDLFGQSFPQMGVKIKTDVSPLPRKKASRKRFFSVALITFAFVLVISFSAFFIIFSFFQGDSAKIGIQKYSPPSIDITVKNLQQDADILGFEIKDRSWNSEHGVIISETNKPINNNLSGLYTYDFYFTSDNQLYYIYSEQEDESYRIFVDNNIIIRVIVGGKNPATYNYGDKEINDNYKKIVEGAKEYADDIEKKNVELNNNNISLEGIG